METSSIIAASIGAGISQSVIFDYFERKAKRIEIVMVRDRKGNFVDGAKLFERKVFYAWLAIVVALCVFANVILLS